MKKITPFLWFDTQAEEAMNFYLTVFKDSKAGSINKLPDGKIVTATFTLENQEFFCINAGPQFKFNEAISFFINCENQEEVDYYWEKLYTNGGQEGQCGWVKDKFGLWWQVVPSALNKLMSDPDREKAGRVMQAMMQMKKIEVAELQKAYDGK